MEWNPAQYGKFSDARRAPLSDLLALIGQPRGVRAVDLGCGPGHLTRELAEHLPESDVVGIDSSAEMLAVATALARPGLRFELGRIEDFAAAAAESDGYDLVFSNAALQWLPDHARLLPGLWARVKGGGQIAVQLPSDDFNPMREVFADVAGWRHPMGTLDISAYAEILFSLGARDITVFEKIYPHVLPDADAVLEWARGTALLPYLDRLPPAQRQPYLDEVRRRLQLEYSRRPVFFPFRRIIFHARRA
jgi:trans-aconitate 2-methyltransferase